MMSGQQRSYRSTTVLYNFWTASSVLCTGKKKGGLKEQKREKKNTCFSSGLTPSFGDLFFLVAHPRCSELPGRGAVSLRATRSLTLAWVCREEERNQMAARWLCKEKRLPACSFVKYSHKKSWKVRRKKKREIHYTIKGNRKK